MVPKGMSRTKPQSLKVKLRKFSRLYENVIVYEINVPVLFIQPVLHYF